MNDRELLELAAKAAGYDLKPHTNNRHSPDLLFTLKGKNWNPLTDDGDALRLVVWLGLTVKVCKKSGFSWVKGFEGSISHEGDPCAATRRAIVRAAAEIGRAMP